MPALNSTRPSAALCRQPLKNLFLACAIILLALAVQVFATSVHAEDAIRIEATNGASNAEIQSQLAGVRQKLEGILGKLDGPRRDDLYLAGLRAEADNLIVALKKTTGALDTRSSKIENQLADLGDPPAEGRPGEATAVTQERSRLSAERAELALMSDDAASLAANATQVISSITTLRRELFTNRLLARTQLSTSVFFEAATVFSREMTRLGTSLANWATFVWQYRSAQLVGALVLSLAAALLFLNGGRRLFGRLVSRDEAFEKPSYIKRLSVAFWLTVTRTMSLAAFLGSSFLFLNSFDVLRINIAPIIAAFFGLVWFVYFVWRLTNAVLTPNQPQWRLVRVTDHGAYLLGSAIIAMAVINGLDYFLGTISQTLYWPLVLTVAYSVIGSLLIGLILIGLSFSHPVLSLDDQSHSGRAWPRWLALLLRGMGMALVLAVLAGYVGLARFVATQFVLTGAVLVTVYIGILSGKAVGLEGAFAQTEFGRKIARRYQLGEVGLDQIGLALSIAIYAFGLIIGLPLVLVTWGFQIPDIEGLAYRFFTNITLGNISISIIGIVGGLALFALGYFLTRWVQRWIDRHVLARSHVDQGVRNSVKTGIGYLGMGLAAIIGVSAAGIDLSSFALVASALSVGIGFGLQNIVSNFVSGLILLVERPFKVGDHVVTGTTEGIVKRISVRATEIETFRTQTIIVPNSELINAAVGNWTHRNRIQRSEIPVSVAYGNDPDHVIAVLLEIVAAIPEVLRNPEPHVEFMAFASSSLDFELRFHLADYSDGLRVRNALRAEILRKFKSEGIAIPYARHDIMILPGDRKGSGPPAPSAIGDKLDGDGA